MTRFDHVQPASKLTNHGQLSSPSCPLHSIPALLRPFQSQFDRNETSLLASQEPNKLAKRLGGLLKPSAKSASCSDVFAQMVLAAISSSTPPCVGQGRTTSLSERMSIFA